MKQLCTILFLFSVFLFPSQNRRKIDSLKQVINNCAEDTNKVIAYYKLSRLFWNSSPDTTIYFATKSLELARKLNDGTGIAGALNSVGVGYSDLAQFDTAVYYYLKAEQAYRAIKNAAGVGMLLNNIGVVYKKQGKYEKAT